MGKEKKSKISKEKEKSLVPVGARRVPPPPAPWPEWGPFSLMRRIREDMDRLFGEFLPARGPEFWPKEGAWGPRADLYETDSEVVVEAEIPGVDPKEVEVTTTPDAITIKGETKKVEEKTEGGIHRAERRYGSFYRRFALPAAVDADKAKATFKNGVLEVRIPKTEKAKGVKLKIEET